MAVPISQMWTVATYVLKQKLKGRKQYPLVLMLEPLFRCNLACAGCGKIQYPSHVLKMQLTPEECFRAVEECGAPTVAIPGGARLLHPQIGEIVEGMVLSPGYSYDKAPDQSHFLGRARTRRLFRAILSNRDSGWRFNMSPLFLEFLMGKRDYACTPWGMPTFNVFGWQKPCYLLQDGYADTFAELLDSTEWEHYGFESGNPKCANCMVHSGYEASAVNDTFGSLRGLWATTRAMLFSGYKDPSALELLDEPVHPVHAFNPLVQINNHAAEETHV